MLPERRDLTFKLDPERICDWHPAGRHVTHFMNALSIFFPEGERFFINSVRHYRNDIRDPELKKAVVAFIGQEAMHSREHVEYNALMTQAGLPADQLDAFVGRLLKRIRDITPPAHRLSATIALEHFTAIMANQLLKSRAQVAGTTPGYADLWHWHALEETEHKAVAFDVYRHVGGKEWVRKTVMNVITTGFVLGASAAVVAGLLLDPRARRDPRGALRELAASPFFTKGMWRRLRDYNRTGFHPDDVDTTELVERWREELFGADGRLRSKVA